MADTFRELCAAMLHAWEKGDDIVGAMNRARALLDAAPDAQAAAWPEPITDRPPTEADGDGHHKVQVRWFNRWETMSVEDAIKSFPVAGWHHTPRWRPPAPSARDAAIDVLRRSIRSAEGGRLTYVFTAEDHALLRQALEGGDD